jgi:ferredoxin
VQTNRWLPRDGLQHLIDELRARGYEVWAPTPRDASIAFRPITSCDELPRGWRDVQSPGAYRLERSERDRFFDVVHGPSAIKPHVFAPRERLLEIRFERASGELDARETPPEPKRIALLGVRACDLAGLAVQDRIFVHGTFPDPYYGSRRAGLLLVAVNCTRSVSTCFCTSMGTGPAATSGFDLALTELDDGFVVASGSEAGADVAAALALGEAPAATVASAGAAVDTCARGMQRSLDVSQMPELLYANLEHPRWEDVAERCLSCGNCTMVCPTCFCHDEREEPSLDGVTSVRVREWDSCFDRAHAQIHGMNARPHIRHRYRQWLVHKLASWIDQFGTSGCVGCGRCITWCPTGIDLTEEVAAIAAAPLEPS